MRQTLDSLYRLSGLLSAFFLLMIAVLVTAQIVGRLFDVLVPSADDFARLSMAASSFLGLAWALRRGAHIRVALLIEKLAPPKRRVAELACLALGTALAGYFAWYALDMVIDGIRFP
jgi:TRAP-type C4-dicarboxylate transport system permease small subunit